MTSLPANLFLQIDPVASNTCIRHTDPLNRIVNPCAVVIDRGPALDTVARIALTDVVSPAKWKLASLRPGDPRVVWSIANVDIDGNVQPRTSPRAAFFPHREANRGRHVFIHGLEPGRIRVEARRQDTGHLLDNFDALVVAKKTVLIRVNLLTTEDRRHGTHITLNMAQRHVGIANRLLRQAGIELEIDPDGSLDPKRRRIAQRIRRLAPGYFDVMLRDEDRALVLHEDRRDQTEAKQALRVNDRDGVVQICYIERNASRNYATEISQPANDLGRHVTLRYRHASGRRRMRRTMSVLPDETALGEPATWGFVITNQSERERPAEQFFANVLAHEMCHVLGLRHREPGVDGLADDPPQRNLMAIPGTATGAIDLDLIQVHAMHHSRVFQR